MSGRSKGWLLSVLGFGIASLLSDISHEAATAAMPAFLAMLGRLQSRWA